MISTRRAIEAFHGNPKLKHRDRTPVWTPGPQSGASFVGMPDTRAVAQGLPPPPGGDRGVTGSVARVSEPRTRFLG